jgi:DNA-binding Lrp family transcriptional regulator
VSSLETSEQALEEGFMEGWWKEIDRDVQSCLERFGPMSPRDLARQLRMSEGAVASVLSMLAQEGKLRISRVELTPDDDGRQLSL